MALIPLPRSQMKLLVPRGKVTPAQWCSYWGYTPVDTLQRILESMLFAYGGAWMAWFLSFMAGPFVSSIFGSITIFNWLYLPYISSQRNNNKMWFNSQGKLLHHALFKGSIQSMRRIRRRSGKTIGALSQDYLDIVVMDEMERELEIITPWREDYRVLREGMTLETVVASSSSKFSHIHSVTDGYIPSCNLWLGDYPFLERSLFRRLCKQLLPAQQSVVPFNSSDDYKNQYKNQQAFMENQTVDVENKAEGTTTIY